MSLLLVFAGTLSGYPQGKTYHINGPNDENLYPYMLYWKDTSGKKNSLDQAVLNLEQGNFITFTSGTGKNMGLFPEPVWFFLNVKNLSVQHQRYWWTFYTHADTIIIYQKQARGWAVSDTLFRGSPMDERMVRHRAPTYNVLLATGENASYLVKIINPRHTQNAFVSFTTPISHLLWERDFYWTIGSFTGVFLLTGIVSFIFGLMTREHTFFLFFVYMLAVSVLTLYNELMTPVVDHDLAFDLLQRMHPLPVSLIATCLNFYIVDYIFGKPVRTNVLKALKVINTGCLIIGIFLLCIYLFSAEYIHSGQLLFLLGWYSLIICIFISILITALKIAVLSLKHHEPYYGITFLLLIVIVNPATYYLNYSGILSFYDITYPNYFYWLAAAEFVFITILMGWRYKKNIEEKHRLQMDLTQRELAVRDEERRQIARDLHDDLGATINAIKLVVTNSYPENKRLIETVTVASNDLRVFYDKLSFSTVDSPLSKNIKKLIRLHSSYGAIKFNLVFSGDESLLSAIQKESLYKMTTELFTNIAKHSGAKEVTVQVMIDRSAAQLIVEDDGKGFAIDQAEKTKGMGIKNIRQRVSEMNGELHISSNKGNTTYIIDIPLS